MNTPTPSFANRRVTVTLVMLVLMLSLGGGSSEGPLERMGAELIGIGLLVPSLLRADWRALYRADRFAAWLGLALLALIAAQLVPLPGALWAGMAGHALYANGDALMFGHPLARPLSLDPGETWACLVFMAPALAVWLRARLDPGFAGIFVRAFLVFLALSLLLALAQVLAARGGVEAGTALHLYANVHSHLPTGLFANRNHQAAAMACGLPLAAWLARRGAGGVGRQGVWLVAALVAIGVLLTGSRAGLVLLVAALVASAAMQADLRALPRRWWLAAAGLAAMGVAALAVALVLAQPGGVLGQVFQRSFTADDQRYSFWPSVAPLVGKYWPWGTGLGAFRYAFEVDEPTGILAPLYLNHAHDEWLEWTLETGLAGVALAAAFLGWLALRLRGGWQKAGEARMAAVVVLVLLAHGFVDYPLRTVALSCAFAVCLAMLSPRGAPDAARVAQPPASPRRRAGVGALALALALVVLATGWARAAVIVDTPEVAALIPLGTATGITARPLGLEAVKLAQQHADFSRVANAATLGVAGSPLNEPAFAAAGLASPNPAQATALLAQAHALSRRDPALLMALFARARGAGDAKGEAVAADELFRQQAAPPALMLGFAHDLARPAVLGAAVRVIAPHSRWLARLFEVAGPDPTATAPLLSLVGALGQVHAPIDRAEARMLIGTLLYSARPNPAAAWTVWNAVAPGENSFGADLPLPFDWLAGEGAEAEAGGLHFADHDTPATAIATREMALPPGQYRLMVVGDGGDFSADVGCNGVARRIANGAAVVIAAACPLQRVALYGTAHQGTVRSAALTR